jgi:hypothetical protein
MSIQEKTEVPPAALEGGQLTRDPEHGSHTEASREPAADPESKEVTRPVQGFTVSIEPVKWPLAMADAVVVGSFGDLNLVGNLSIRSRQYDCGGHHPSKNPDPAKRWTRALMPLTGRSQSIR